MDGIGKWLWGKAGEGGSERPAPRFRLCDGAERAGASGETGSGTRPGENARDGSGWGGPLS